MGDGSAAFGGLEVCGSAWECPVCASRVRANHARELVRVARAHREAGGRAYLVTLTLRHGWGDDLAALRKGLADAWRSLVRGAPWQRWKERVGFVGFARAMELTYGKNGWHPHLHVMVLTRRELDDDPMSDDDWRSPALHLAERWRAAVLRVWEERRKAAPHVPQPDRLPDITARESDDPRCVYDSTGCRIDEAAAGDAAASYLTKLGLEVSGVGKRGSRTPWALLARAVEGDMSALARWVDYGRAMRGARVLTWSRAVRDLYAIEDEDDAAPRGYPSLLLSGRAWSLIRLRDGEVLDVARTRGVRGVLEWMLARDPVAWRETLDLTQEMLASGAPWARPPPSSFRPAPALA